MSQASSAVAQVLVDFDNFKVTPRALQLPAGAKVQFRSTGSCSVIKPFLQVVKTGTGEVVFCARELRVGSPCTCPLQQEGLYSFHSEVFPFLKGQVRVGMDQQPEQAGTTHVTALQPAEPNDCSIRSEQAVEELGDQLQLPIATVAASTGQNAGQAATSKSGPAEVDDMMLPQAEVTLPPGEQMEERTGLQKFHPDTASAYQEVRSAVIANIPSLSIPDPTDGAPEEPYLDALDDLVPCAKVVTHLHAVRAGHKSGSQSTSKGSRAGSGKAGRNSRPGSPATRRNEAQEINANSAAASAAAREALTLALACPLSPKLKGVAPHSPGRNASGPSTPTRTIHRPLSADFDFQQIQRSHSSTSSQASKRPDLDARSGGSFSAGSYGSRGMLDGNHSGSALAQFVASYSHSGVRRSQGGSPSPLGRTGSSSLQGHGYTGQPDAPASPSRRAPRNSAPVCATSPSPLGISAPPHLSPIMVSACTSPTLLYPPGSLPVPTSPHHPHVVPAPVVPAMGYNVLANQAAQAHAQVQAASFWSQSVANASMAAMNVRHPVMQPGFISYVVPVSPTATALPAQVLNSVQMPGSPVHSSNALHHFSQVQQGVTPPRAQPLPTDKHSRVQSGDDGVRRSHQRSDGDVGKAQGLLPSAGLASELMNDHDAGCSSREPTSGDGHIAVAPDVSALHGEALLGQWEQHQRGMTLDSEQAMGADDALASCKDGNEQAGSSCSGEAMADDDDLAYVRLEDEAEHMSRASSGLRTGRPTERHVRPHSMVETVSKHTGRLPLGSHFSVDPQSRRLVSEEEGDVDSGNRSASSSSSGGVCGRRQAQDAWHKMGEASQQHRHQQSSQVAFPLGRCVQCPTCRKPFVVAFNLARCQNMHQLLASKARKQGNADRDLRALHVMVKEEVLDWLTSDEPERMRKLFCLDPAHEVRNRIVLQEFTRKNGCGASESEELQRVVKAGKRLHELVLAAADRPWELSTSGNMLLEDLMAASEGAGLQLSSPLDIELVTVPESVRDMDANTGCAEAALAYMIETWLLKLVWETRMLQMSSARARLNTLLHDTAQQQVDRMLDAIWTKGLQPAPEVRNLETVLTVSNSYHNHTLPSLEVLQEMACLVPVTYRREFLEGVRVSDAVEKQASTAVQEGMEVRHLRDRVMGDARSHRSIGSSMQGHESGGSQNSNPMRHYGSMWDADDSSSGHAHVAKEKEGGAGSGSAQGASSGHASGAGSGLHRSASGREGSSSRHRASSKEAGRATKTWQTCTDLMNRCKDEGLSWNWEHVFLDHGVSSCLHVPTPDELLAFNKKDDWSAYPKVMPTSATCSGCGTRYHNALNAHRCEQRHKEVHGDASLHGKAGHAAAKGGNKLLSRKSQGVSPVDSRVHDLKAFWARLVSSQPATAAAVLALRPLTHDTTWPDAEAYGSSPAGDFWKAAAGQLLNLTSNWVLIGKPSRRTSHSAFMPDHKYYVRMYGLALCIQHARNSLDVMEQQSATGATEPAAAPPEPQWILPPWDDICACLRVVTEGTMLTFTATQPGQVLHDFMIAHVNAARAVQPFSKGYEIRSDNCPDAVLALLLELSLMAALCKEHERAEALSRSLLLAEEEADAASKRKQLQAAASHKDKSSKQKAARKAASNRSSHAPSHADTSSEDEGSRVRGADGDDGHAVSGAASAGGQADSGPRYRAFGSGGGETEGSSDVVELGAGSIPLLGSQLDEAVRNLELQQADGFGQLQRRDSGGLPSGQHQPASDAAGLQRKHSGTSGFVPVQQAYSGVRPQVSSTPYNSGTRASQTQVGVGAAYGTGQGGYSGRQQLGGRGGRGPSTWVDKRGVSHQLMLQNGPPASSRPPRGDIGSSVRTSDAAITSVPHSGALLSRASSGSEHGGGGRRAPSPGSAAGTMSVSPVTSLTAPVAVQQPHGRRTPGGMHAVQPNLPAAVEDALSFMSSAATAVAHAQPVMATGPRGAVLAQQAAARSQVLQRPVPLTTAPAMLQTPQSGPAAAMQLPSPAQGRGQAGRGSKAMLQRFPSSGSSGRDQQDGNLAAALVARDGNSSGMSSRSTTSGGAAPVTIAGAAHVALSHIPTASPAAQPATGLVPAAQHAAAHSTGPSEAARVVPGTAPAAMQLPQGHMLHMLPSLGMNQHPHAHMMAGMMSMQPMWVPSTSPGMPGMPQAGHVVMPYGMQGAHGQQFLQYFPMAMHPGMPGMMQHQVGMADGMAAMQAYGMQGMHAPQPQLSHQQHAAGVPGHAVIPHHGDQRAAGHMQAGGQPPVQYYMVMGPDGHTHMMAAPSQGHPSTQPPPPPPSLPGMQSPVMLQGGAYPGTTAAAASAPPAIHALAHSVDHSAALPHAAQLQLPVPGTSPLPSPAGRQPREHGHDRSGRASSLTSPHPRHQQQQQQPPSQPVQQSSQDVRTSLAREPWHGGRGGRDDRGNHDAGGRGGGRGAVPSGPYAIPTTQTSTSTQAQKPITVSSKPQQAVSSTAVPAGANAHGSTDSSSAVKPTAAAPQQPAVIVVPTAKPEVTAQAQRSASGPANAAPPAPVTTAKQLAEPRPVAMVAPVEPSAPSVAQAAPQATAPAAAPAPAKQGGNSLTALLKSAFAKAPQQQPPAAKAPPTLSAQPSVDAATSRTHSQHQAHHRGFQAHEAADQLHSRWAQALAEMEADE